MNQVIEHPAQNKLPVTAAQIQQQVNTIRQVMDQVMKKDTHYGVIPGTQKPTLYKAGAEKLLATFRLAPKLEITDLSGPDERRFRVVVSLYTVGGEFVGQGAGECSTSEEKYRWRACYIDKEFDAAPEDRRRIKYSQNRRTGEVYENKQIRTEPADLANTALKMAKKRGLVDATLTTTAASDCFDQDIEDLPEGLVDGEPPVRQSKTTQRAANAAAAAAPKGDADPAIIAALQAEATKGLQALTAKWGSLTADQRAAVGSDFGPIRKAAQEADNAG